MSSQLNGAGRPLGLKAGEWVRVRSKEEILATLDANGRLDGLPFMPQMLEACGQRLQVRKRAHKLCDTANSTGGRRMANAVFLGEVRCNGAAYGGCELQCLVLWKEAWLERDAPGTSDAAVRPTFGASPDPLVEVIWAGTRGKAVGEPAAEPTYVCQATQLPFATSPLSRWDLRQYVEDYTSGNARLREIMSGLIFIVYENLASSGIGLGAAFRWLYDVFQRLRGGSPYPSRRGLLPDRGRTPSVDLNLQVGELVRVKTHAEILATVDESLRNRGMGFHSTMVPYCGQTFKVLQRAGKIMNERTGQLMTLKNECLVLKGADCVGKYTNPLLCPRSCYPYWREIWLERVNGGESASESTLEDRTPPGAAH